MRARVLRASTALAVAAVTAGAAATSGAGAAPARPCGGNTELAGQGWIAARVPQLSHLADVVGVTYAPDRIYATDGDSTLVRSDDGGCHWTSISPSAPSLGGLGVGRSAIRIASISAPSSTTVQSYLYVGVNVTPTNQLPASLPSQPYVYSSAFAGTRMSASNKGLPLIGTVTQVAASGTVPLDVYAVIKDAGSQSGVYFSGDGGSTWTQRGSDPSLGDLRVSPAAPNDLFALGAGGLMTSVDGGKTFAPISPTRADVSSYDVAAGSGSVQIVQGHSGAHHIDVSIDNGRTWHVAPTFPVAHDVATAATVPVLAVADPQRVDIVTASVHSYLSFNVTPDLGAPVDLQMSAPTARGLSIVGVSQDRRVVLRAVLQPGAHHLSTPSIVPVSLLPQVQVKQFPSTLTAATHDVRLPAGGHREVPYRLLMPRTPSPVDIMFLVDSTDSEAATINGVRQALAAVVNELSTSGLDVKFGLADYKDYPYLWGGNGDDSDYPYRLRARIGAAASVLARELARLKAAGGGDADEATLTALYQSTTGAGQRIVRHVVVPPGQQAGYRSDSLRLAVVASDAAYHKESDYPTPSWASVVAALNAAGVHQVGLAVQDNDKGDPLPNRYDSLRDERRMAAATGAVAPTGGVDCNSDGISDVPAGAPMVCKVAMPKATRITINAGVKKQTLTLSPPPPLHLGPAISELAQALPEYRNVTLHIAGAPAGDARLVSAPAAPRVNVHTDNALNFVVRYTCPTSVKGGSWPLTVTATAGSRTLTSTPMTLTCGVVPPKPSLLPPAAAVTAAIAPAPPNPPTNINGNTNPNPALNPNAGFATQDEQQPQVALADADQGAGEESLAMSRRTTDGEAAWLLGAASLLTGAAGAYATRTRWRVARGHADVRS